jgi:hypothetical protein
MPIYDIICEHCEGIFEKILPVAALRRVDTWRPASRSEQLAGAGVAGPGMQAGGGRDSVLHNCKGFNCSMCGV